MCMTYSYAHYKNAPTYIMYTKRFFLKKIRVWIYITFSITCPILSYWPNVRKHYGNSSRLPNMLLVSHTTVTADVYASSQTAKLCTHTHWRSAVYPLARFIDTLDLQLLTALDEQEHTRAQFR